jgi:tetratricopeptide (TPR) repeat protein
VDRVTELRALYQERRLAEARALYEREPGYTDPEWYWLGSLVYWHLQQYPLSRWAADYGLSLRPDGEMRVKLLQRLGNTEERLGDFRAAIMHLEACLAELPAYPSLAAIMKGTVLYALALAFYNRSPDAADVQASIYCYEQAAQEFRREDMRDYLRMTLQNLAWALCDAAEPGRAADVLDEVAPLCITASARRVQQVTNAYQLLVAGDHTRSLAMVEPLVQQEDESDTFILSLCVMSLAALNLYERAPGMLDTANAMAQQAIFGSLRPGTDPRCWTTANRVQKRITQVLKQHNTRGA